jgi:hypothetical protein
LCRVKGGVGIGVVEVMRVFVRIDARRSLLSPWQVVDCHPSL